MSIRLGTTNPAKFQLGTNPVSRLCRGNAEVWSPIVPSLVKYAFDGSYANSVPGGATLSATAGSPSFDTSVKKYGAASLSLNNGYASTANNAIPDLSGTDYTIEFWLRRPAANDNYEGVIHLAAGSSGTAGVNIHLYTGSSIHFNNGAYYAVSGGALAANTWTHVACVSISGWKRLFVDGVLAEETNQGTPAGPYRLLVGYTRGLSYTSPARIDDLRITPAALYCGTFTPPAAALPTTAINPGCSPPAFPPYGTFLREDCNFDPYECAYGGYYADGAGGEYFDAWDEFGCCS